MNPKKAGLIVVWLACAAGFTLMPGTPTALLAEVVFWSLVVIHTLQWLAFREILSDSQNGAIGNLAGTLLFGIVHINEVRAEVEGKPSGA